MRQSDTVKNPETQYFQWFRGFLLHTLSFKKVPAVGLEPTRSCPRKILSLVRLPIPPHRLVDTMAMRHQRIIVYINMIRLSISFFIFSVFKNVNIKFDIFSCFYRFAVLHNTQPVLLYIFTFRQRNSKAATAASLSRSLFPFLCKLLYLFLE